MRRQYEIVGQLDISSYASSVHSTTTALHRLVDDLLDNMNEGMVNAICFFDLKKCFDSIDHKLLILKLEKYGILDREMLWFTDGSSSSFNDINVGSPTGISIGSAFISGLY